MMKKKIILFLCIILLASCTNKFAKYSDGGEICNSSEECQGNCIIRSEDTTNSFCEYSNGTRGCYTTIESYRVDNTLFKCAD